MGQIFRQDLYGKGEEVQLIFKGLKKQRLKQMFMA